MFYHVFLRIAGVQPDPEQSDDGHCGDVCAEPRPPQLCCQPLHLLPLLHQRGQVRQVQKKYKNKSLLSSLLNASHSRGTWKKNPPPATSCVCAEHACYLQNYEYQEQP